MVLRQFSRGLPFRHLPDQVNAAPWTVQLITQQRIGGTGRQTEAAMHTGLDELRRFLRELVLRMICGNLDEHGSIS